MTDDEYENFPDVRAFCRKITDVDRKPIFDKFAEVTKALRENAPPKLDIDGWRFNDFKTHIARNLSDEELADLQAMVEQAKHSSLPQWKINSYVQSVEQIEELRKGSD